MSSEAGVPEWELKTPAPGAGMLGKGGGSGSTSHDTLPKGLPTPIPLDRRQQNAPDSVDPELDCRCGM